MQLQKIVALGGFLGINYGKSVNCQEPIKRVYKDRQGHLEEVEQTEEYDVMVIGGGATGCGVFLNATANGLKTLLIESNDFGSATSTKSSKLLHGGLRYWQRIFNPFSTTRSQDYHLVKEAIKERDILLKNAPYITNHIGLIVPSSNFFQNLFNFLGIKLYHSFSLFQPNQSQVPPPQFLTKNDLYQIFPKMNPYYQYGVLMYDGQFIEQRMIMDCLLTASSIQNSSIVPGNILNYAKLVSFKKDLDGRIISGQILDKINNKVISVKAKKFINATGIFSDKIRQMANESLNSRIVAAQGEHVTIDIGFFNQDKIGLIAPKTKDGRIMFFIPWNNSIILGTTDHQEEQPLSFPNAHQQQINDILECFGEYFPNQEFKIKSKWAGMRPLVTQGINQSSKEISRQHVIEHDQKSGLTSIMGGKWTAFRIMGEHTIHEIMDNVFGDRVKKSTESLHLIGDFQHNYSKQQISQHDSPTLILQKQLMNKYGERWKDIYHYIKQDSNKQLLIDSQSDITVGEIEFLIKTEMVEFPIDLIVRRLTIPFQDSQLAYQFLPKIVEIFGNLKKWSKDKKYLEYQKNLMILNQMSFNQFDNPQKI